MRQELHEATRQCTESSSPQQGSPGELPPLEDILAIDAERIYQLEQVRIQTCKVCEGLIDYVWGMDAAKTSETQIIDILKLKGKAKVAAATGPTTEEIQFLE